MAKYHFIIDYYLKGLDPDCYRHVFGALKDAQNRFFDRDILKKDKFVKEFRLNNEQYDFLYETVYWQYENINRYLIKHKREPFFDTTNLADCIKKRDELLEFLTEEECIKKYGVTTFEDYVPKEYCSDLTTVAELYTTNQTIIECLKTKKIPKINLLSGIAGENPYKFINDTLLYQGLKPLFLDTENKIECEQKRKELVKFLPYKDCLKYYGVTTQAELEKFKIKPLILKIEKLFINSNILISTYGYYIGRNFLRILSPSETKIDKHSYIKECNRLSNTTLFKNVDNLEECIEFLKEELVFVTNEDHKG